MTRLRGQIDYDDEDEGEEDLVGGIYLGVAGPVNPSGHAKNRRFFAIHPSANPSESVSEPVRASDDEFLNWEFTFLNRG